MNASEIEQAKRNAARARARVESTAGALRQRMAPANLAAEAKAKVRTTRSAIQARATDAVRKRPVAASAIGGLLALVVLRKPVKLVGKLFRRRKPDETAAPRDQGLMRAGAPPQPSITPRIQRAVSEANARALNKE